jgi:alpha-tubulin suppressor-like RCC1 family protein
MVDLAMEAKLIAIQTLYGTVNAGTFENRSSPVKISFVSLDEDEYVFNIIAGSQYNIAITSNSKVYSWGRNQIGQLVYGTTFNKNIPVMIYFFSINIFEYVSLPYRKAFIVV